jgi:hypothetical protein
LFIEVSYARPPQKLTYSLKEQLITTTTATTTTMKSPSDAQNTRTNPSALSSSNSILQALSGGNVVETPVLPIPVSAEVRRERLRMILASAIAVIESGNFDPIDSSKTQPPQPPW